MISDGVAVAIRHDGRESPVPHKREAEIWRIYLFELDRMQKAELKLHDRLPSATFSTTL